MSCGCAAVTTPTGFGAELRDGEEALLCPFGDVAAMGKSIARLLDDEAFRARVAEAGWRRAQGLRWQTSVRKLEAVYRRWLGETAAGAEAAARREPTADRRHHRPSSSASHVVLP